MHVRKQLYKEQERILVGQSHGYGRQGLGCEKFVKASTSLPEFCCSAGSVVFVDEQEKP